MHKAAHQEKKRRDALCVRSQGDGGKMPRGLCLVVTGSFYGPTLKEISHKVKQVSSDHLPPPSPLSISPCLSVFPFETANPFRIGRTSALLLELEIRRRRRRKKVHGMMQQRWPRQNLGSSIEVVIPVASSFA